MRNAIGTYLSHETNDPGLEDDDPGVSLDPAPQGRFEDQPPNQKSKIVTAGV